MSRILRRALPLAGFAAAWLAAGGPAAQTAGAAAVSPAAPVLAPNLADVCSADPAHPSSVWHVSRALQPELWRSRLTCVSDGEERALRVTVHPHDSADPASGNGVTERVEVELRRQLVRFESPVWYRFRFRLVEPWQGTGNRTVIHQVKQDVEPSREAGGTCPSANPFFKIEARPTPAGAAFLVKARGTADCRDGRAGQTICGPWPLATGRWHDVHVLLKPSQRDGGSEVEVWLDGAACPFFTGRLGYADHGVRDPDGHPLVNVQPRFGIYRDALPGTVQSIDFADLAFWTSDPSGDPAWAGIDARER